MIHPLSLTQTVRTPLVPYHSLCSSCMTNRTPWHTVGYQVLRTKPVLPNFFFAKLFFLFFIFQFFFSDSFLKKCFQNCSLKKHILKLFLRWLPQKVAPSKRYIFFKVAPSKNTFSKLLF